VVHLAAEATYTVQQARLQACIREHAGLSVDEVREIEEMVSACAGLVTIRDREKHVLAQTKRVFEPNRTVFEMKPNQTGQTY
jgi:hypothetical protein